MSDSELNAGGKVKAKNHDSYGTLTLVTIVIPIVGFILGIIYLAKDRKLDKKLGEHLLALSILFGIVWSVVLSMTIFKTTTITPIAIVSTPNSQFGSDTDATPAPVVSHIGSQINVGGKSGLTVNVQQIIDPASSGNQYIKADAGKRFVGVKLEITYNGYTSYNDNANSNVSLMGSDNQNAVLSFYPISGCTSFSSGTYTLSSGASATGCVVFQLPTGVTAKKVQFQASGAYAGSSGEWLVP